MGRGCCVFFYRGHPAPRDLVLQASCKSADSKSSLDDHLWCASDSPLQTCDGQQDESCLFLHHLFNLFNSRFHPHWKVSFTWGVLLIGPWHTRQLCGAVHLQLALIKRDKGKDLLELFHGGACLCEAALAAFGNYHTRCLKASLSSTLSSTTWNFAYKWGPLLCAQGFFLLPLCEF